MMAPIRKRLRRRLACMAWSACSCRAVADKATPCTERSRWIAGEYRRRARTRPDSQGGTGAFICGSSPAAYWSLIVFSFRTDLTIQVSLVGSMDMRVPVHVM